METQQQNTAEQTQQQNTADLTEEQKLEAEKKRKSDRLGTEPLWKLMAEFAAPCILGMVFAALYNVIDAAFLGIALPDGSGVAVMTLTWPIMCLLNGFSMWAGQGGSALGAIQMGEGKKDEVEKTLGNTAVLLFVIAGIVALIAAVFIDGVLALIGTPPELWENTKQFTQIICFFFAFQSVCFGLSNFIRVAGSPNFAMGVTIFCTVACAVFNYLFVLVLGWGVAGSAWANVIGYGLGAIPVVWYFTANKKSMFRLRLRNCIPIPRTAGRILVMGLASLAMQIGNAVVSIVFNQVVGFWAASDPIGITGILAGLGVAQKVIGFAFMFIIGFALGVQPIIGYNYGAQKWDRATKLFKWSSIDGAIIGTIAFLLSHLIPYQIITLFGVTGDLKDFAVWGLQIYTLWFPFVGYQAVASCFFQASGQPVKSLILELSRQIIILIPLYLFMPPLLMAWFGVTGVQGVVLCVPISDAIATMLTTIFVIREARRLRRLRNGEASVQSA